MPSPLKSPPPATLMPTWSSEPVLLSLKPLLPVSMEIVSGASDREPIVYVTLTEGRYHQVRRMFAALGNHVVALHRDRVGGLSLPTDLAPGAYRILEPHETAMIFA